MPPALLYDIKTTDLAKLVIADDKSVFEIRDKILKLFVLLGNDDFYTTYISTLFSDICREMLSDGGSVIEAAINSSSEPYFVTFQFFMSPSISLKKRIERFFDKFETSADSPKRLIKVFLNLAPGALSKEILKEIRDVLSFTSKEQLTEEKKNLEKVNLELDSFVYTASHDLRAPLRAISSFASFLEEDNKEQLDETGRDHLMEIRKGVDRMTKLIDDLLTLSKISRLQNPYENVDMNALIENARQRIEFDINEKNTKLHIQSKLPAVYCDRIKMTEVFVNLMNNAVKFTSKGSRAPKIEVGGTESEYGYQFYVSDNGIGIEPKYHDQIFGLFKRLHTQEEYEGTGAGLNIVKRVIEDHKGRIWVVSELGKGAKFVFTIPKNYKANREAIK